jgi:DNA-binding transcriptional LysR family regulator
MVTVLPARAAEALGLSPSGVSTTLSRLEQRVGARLLARTTRSLSLTDEGRRFYEQVGPHLAGIDEAAIEASGSTNKVRGRLRVNIDPFFSQNRLVRASRGVPDTLSGCFSRTDYAGFGG